MWAGLSTFQIFVNQSQGFNIGEELEKLESDPRRHVKPSEFESRYWFGPDEFIQERIGAGPKK